MKKKTPATFGDRLINFHLPDAWHKLEQWQLRYVCYIMTRFDPVTAKTYIFVRLLGITVLRKQEDGWVCSVRNGWKKVRFFVHSWQVQSFLHMLDFIERPGVTPCVGVWIETGIDRRGYHKGERSIADGLLAGVDRTE